ncbi:MAG: aminotransferase class I/II-fold pyridoxal phosphate-dependent enzyme [Anaerolineaceae bacterium]|nr:aminotransferase class I/II-fold pyridoxal phosphate-dependent enzyme [Anaerolineaceae bacterium]
MKIKPFEIELYFAKYEFNCKHLLCASDCESISIDELLQLADMPQKDLLETHLNYTESQGDPILREKIADMTADVSAEDVVFLSSPEEGIFIAMHALLDKGDHVIVVSPVYESLLNLAEHITHNISLWPFRLKDGVWWLDEEELYRLATPQTRLLIINFPHNPTGYLPDEAMFKRLLHWAANKGITIFCDEMYRGLELGERKTLPSAVELNPDVIVLSGLSKTYGLPGLRSGWLIVKNPVLRDEVLNWKMYTSICATRPGEALSLAALACRETLAQRNRDLIQQNIAGAKPFFERWQNIFEWIPTQAGSVALIGIKQFSAQVFCETLAQAGILLLPSTYMNYSDTHIRFGFGRKSFLENLKALDAHLTKHYPEKCT